MTRATRTTGNVLAVALLAGVACLGVSTGWSAPQGGVGIPADITAEQLAAQRPAYTAEQLAAAKKNPLYESIYRAKSVVVAKLDKIVEGPTTMMQPPTSTMTLTLTVETVLRGPLTAKQQITFAYSVRGPGFGPQLGPNGNPLGTPLAKVGRNAEFDPRLRPAGSPLGGVSTNTPALVLGKQYVVAQGSSPGFIGEASDELLPVVRIAAAEANNADAADLALARAKPTEHPLYKPLKAADGVVVANIDLGGIVGFDKRGFSRFPVVCVAGMKGGLKRGDRFQALFPPSVAPQGKLPDGEFLILGYKQVAAGRYEITSVSEASEANLVVAAAATGTAVLAPKDLKTVETPPAKESGAITIMTGARSAITVSIALPLRHDQRILERSAGDAHFHVLITNNSTKPQKIWREWCSWGYDALSFEITDESGKTWIAKKRPREWDKNFPDAWTLPPGETLVLDVHFADPNVWEGFPTPSGTSQTVTVRAIFEIGPEKGELHPSVWTGRSVSKADKYVIYK